MTDFTKIKTKFVKNKLKNTSWSKREYIKQLMFLESWISEEIRGLGAAYKAHVLKEKYAKEYKAIFLELAPEEYKRLKEKEKRNKEKEERENKELNKELKKEFEIEKKSWKE